MNPEFKNIDLIERYFKGQLTVAEKKSFEQTLLEDVSFKEDFEAYKAVHEAVIEKETVELRNQISLDMDRFFIDDNKKSNRRILGLSIISLLLISSVAYVFLKDNEREKHLSKDEILKVEEIKDSMPIEKIDAVKLIPLKAKKSENLDSVVISKQSLVEDTLMLEKDTIIEVKVLSDSIAAKNMVVTENNKGIEKEKKVKDPCLGKTNNFTLKTTDAAYDINNGSISVDVKSISNIREVTFALNTSEFSNTYLFEGLEDGGYTVTLKDNEGCLFTLKTQVNRNFCLEDYTKTFSKEYDIEWLIPTNINKEVGGEITLVNSRGSIIYTSYVEAGEHYYWNGEDENNNVILPDYYRFIINYNDGEKCIGDLTILK